MLRSEVLICSTEIESSIRAEGFPLRENKAKSLKNRRNPNLAILPKFSNQEVSMRL